MRSGQLGQNCQLSLAGQEWVAALPDTPEEMEGGQMGPEPGLPQEADNLRLGAEGEKLRI
jgi:hypothetical protein